MGTRLAHRKHLGSYWRIQEGVYLLFGFLPIREHRDIPLKLHSHGREHLKPHVRPFIGLSEVLLEQPISQRDSGRHRREKGLFGMRLCRLLSPPQHPETGRHQPSIWAYKGQCLGSCGLGGKSHSTLPWAQPEVLFFFLTGTPMSQSQENKPGGKSLREKVSSSGRLGRSPNPGATGAPGKD